MKIFWNMLMMCGVTITSLQHVQVNAAEVLYEQWKEISVVASRYPAIIPILQRSGYPAISVAPEYGTKAQIIERNCPVVAKSKLALSCGGKATAPPTNTASLSIDDKRFPSMLYWGPNIRDSMTGWYNISDIYLDRSDPARTAIMAAATSCGQDAACNREVAVFFGRDIVSVPNLPYVGDLNELINNYYRRVGSTANLVSSYDQLVNRYAGGAVCKALNDAELRTGCQ